MRLPTTAPPEHAVVLDRFVAACQADERVEAAFLAGSYARGAADAFSDLDVGVITRDDAYESFVAGRDAFLRELGEPVFVEDFGSASALFFMLADGTEGEIGLGRASDFRGIHQGPYRVLLDRAGLLAGTVFGGQAPEPAEQHEALRRLMAVFWHDVSHFITAMGRGQLWWAHGQLDTLRLMCVNLARLRQDFEAPLEGYDKIEQAVPAEKLAPLQPTFCPLDVEAMRAAGKTLIRFYQDVAPGLAAAHGLAYPERLERLMLDRLERQPGTRPH